MLTGFVTLARTILINVDGERTFDVKVTNFCTQVPIFSVVRHEFVKTHADTINYILQFYSRADFSLRVSKFDEVKSARCLFSLFFSGVLRNSLVDKAWLARVFSPRDYL